MLLSSSKLFFSSKEAHLNSGLRLLLELYCVIAITPCYLLYIWGKLTLAFTCASLPLNLPFTLLFLFSGGWRDLTKKRHGSADLNTPIHPLKKGLCVSSRRTWKTETLFSLSCFSLQLIIITFSSISSISSSRVHVKLTALPLFLSCAKQRIAAFVHARFLTNLDLTKYIQCIYQRTGIAPAMLKLHTEVQNSPSYFWAVKT